MFFQYVLFRGSKNYGGIKNTCLEYAENIKMMDGTAASIFQQTKKFDKDRKETKIDELCKQVENLRLMMMKEHIQAPKHAEPVCYKCGKKGYYASKRRMEHVLICYKGGKNGHRASECRSKVDIPPTCTYCHWIGHITENCFVKRSNEDVEEQDVSFTKDNEPSKAKGAGPSGRNNITFVKIDDPIEEENTVAAFEIRKWRNTH